jgi:hypothetical protein
MNALFLGIGGVRFRRSCVALCLIAPALLACSDGKGPVQPAPGGLRVTITSPSEYLDVGQTLALQVTVTDASGADRGTGGLGWTSGDPAVAEVAGGAVTGRSPGPVWIRAAVAGAADSVRLVVETPLASLEILPDSLFLILGRSARLFVEMRDDAGRPMEHSLTLSSSDRTVATVDATGEVRGIALGAATVTLTAGLERVEVPVRVVSGELYSVRELGGETPWWGSGINNRGEVVGTTAYSGDPFGFRGVLWRKGRALDLGPGRAWDVNDGGTVALTNHRDRFVLELLLWKDGGRSLLEGSLFSGYHDFIATGATINSRDWVVVTAYIHYGPGAYADESRLRTSTHLSGNLGNSPPALNDRGDVVINRGRTIYTFIPGLAEIWNDGNTTSVHQPRPEAEWWRLMDINNSGQAVGTYGAYGPGSPAPSIETLGWYIWGPDGSTDLGPRPGRPVKLNDHGDILGVDPEGRITVLRNSRSIDVPAQIGEWDLLGAGAMNDLGQIVASGRHRATGRVASVLLTPSP